MKIKDKIKLKETWEDCKSDNTEWVYFYWTEGARDSSTDKYIYWQLQPEGIPFRSKYSHAFYKLPLRKLPSSGRTIQEKRISITKVFRHIETVALNKEHRK